MAIRHHRAKSYFSWRGSHTKHCFKHQQKFRHKQRTSSTATAREYICYIYHCFIIYFHSRYWYDWLLIHVYNNTKYISVKNIWFWHYYDVIMGAIASQITSLTIVYSIVYSDADKRKHQSSASLAFVRGIHRRPVNSPHKWPVTRKVFPFDDVIMIHFLNTVPTKTMWLLHVPEPMLTHH